MLPQHPLPQLIPNRIQTTLSRIHGLVWQKQVVLSVEATKAQAEQLPLKAAQKRPRTRVEPRSYWGHLFDQRWCLIHLPAVTDDKTWLHWRDQGEATLYVKGVPYFGFNVAHRYCRLPAGIRRVWIQSSCIQSAIWHPEAKPMATDGCLFEEAKLCTRHDEAWSAYHDLKCLFDLAMYMRKRENPQAQPHLRAAGLQDPQISHTPAYRILWQVMDEAADAFYRNGLSALHKRLEEAYKVLRSSRALSRCVLTGHAHLDLVWIWPERMGELKAVNLFATAHHLMSEYPEYRFAYSQPASYEAVKRREPELYRQVLGRIQSKQWEATGAMYVESDTIFACGEALARSFILGQEGFKKIAGAPSKTTWLPDVFGYSACLPQIMKQTGVNYFFTTKMTWNAINRFPFSSFVWRGNDGSEVLAHVTQDSGYVTQVSVDNIKAPMLANQQAAMHKEYMLPTGFGDGGGGATDEMLERARRLNLLPGMPEIVWDHPESFFKRLNRVRDKLPVHQGECYLEYHRGTFTTHGNLKWSFRNLERAMQTAEAVASATGKTWEMETAWKRLIFAQFHDYIPGSSVWDVYREGLPQLNDLAHHQLNKAEEALTGQGTNCLFNPHAIPVKAWVQATSRGKAAYVSLPAMGGVRWEDAKISAPAPVTIKGSRVSNGLCAFHINASGWMDELVWENVRVPCRQPLGQLLLYPDIPAHFDAWDIDRQTLSLGSVCQAPARIEAFVEGPHSGFRVSRKIGQRSHATISFFLEGGSPLVHLRIELDWQEPETLLKINFPTKYAATHARFGSPFGSVLRPQVANGMQAEAMWEVPFNRFLAVFDEGESEGLFVVSESKYGATVRDGEIGVSLVRSPKVTGFDGHGRAWPAHLSRLEGLSPFSDLGAHKIQLSLGCYDLSLPRERQPASLADTLFTPPIVYQGMPISPVIRALTGGETLVPCWAKPCEKGGWILRLHEVAGKRGVAELQVEPGWKMEQCNLGETGFTKSGGQISFTPYEVLGVRIFAGNES